jgi:arginase
VAIHFDVDTIDADEIQLGLGADRGGLTTAEARPVVADIDARPRLSLSPSRNSYLVR